MSKGEKLAKTHKSSVSLVEGKISNDLFDTVITIAINNSLYISKLM